MIDTKLSHSSILLTADELAGARALTNDEIAEVTGGVAVCYGPSVICYGPSPRPHPGPHDGAPFVPPGGLIP